MKFIEDEKKKLFLLAKHLEARALNLGRNLPPLVISPEKNENFSSGIASNQQVIRKNSKFINFNQDNNNDNGDETIFESFLGDENIYYHNNLRKKNSFLNNNLNILGPANMIGSEGEKVELLTCIQEFKSYCPQKYVNF